LASQSRIRTSPLRSRSLFPLIVSPSTLPLYFILKVLPLRSTSVVKLTSSFLNDPSLMSILSPIGSESWPVSFSPSAFRASDSSKSCPFCVVNFQVQVPLGSAAAPARAARQTNAASVIAAVVANRMRAMVETPDSMRWFREPRSSGHDDSAAQMRQTIAARLSARRECSRLPVNPRRLLGDQPRGAAASQIAVGPLTQDEQPVLELCQIEQVHQQPGHPCQKARKVHPAQVGHRRGPPDGRHVSPVPIAERTWRFAA